MGLHGRSSYLPDCKGHSVWTAASLATSLSATRECGCCQRRPAVARACVKAKWCAFRSFTYLSRRAVCVRDKLQLSSFYNLQHKKGGGGHLSNFPLQNGQFCGDVSHISKYVVRLKMDPHLEGAVELHPFSQTNVKFEPLSLLLTSTQSLHSHA